MKKTEGIKSIILALVAVLSALSGLGQVTDTSSQELPLGVIAQENQGNSYITFPSFVGNIEPLWFEANVMPGFYIRKSKNSRLMGVIIPQIMIRMFREESYPIRTPSYMPHITAYYSLCENPGVKKPTIYAKIGHHSNGQEGAFYADTNQINYLTGNFATNFIELGFITTRKSERLNAYQFFKTGIEVHPGIGMQAELRGRYSSFRWRTAVSVFKLADGNQMSKKPGLSLKGEVLWMFGDYMQLSPLSGERLNLKITAYYQPAFLEDIGFFVRYYHGNDYYNIYFDHRIDIIQLGLMTEKLRF